MPDLLSGGSPASSDADDRASPKLRQLFITYVRLPNFIALHCFKEFVDGKSFVSGGWFGKVYKASLGSDVASAQGTGSGKSMGKRPFCQLWQMYNISNKKHHLGENYIL
jgi:hypothetical protein